MSDRPSPPPADRGVPFRTASRFWIKLGFINFGGPTGQIAIMHEELVDRLRWIDEDHFLHALNYCVLLPGPEAQQLAIYVGWLLHKVKGGLVAGIAFIAPAFFLMLALSWTYAAHGDVRAVGGVFEGLQAAVVGIITAALIRIARPRAAGRIPDRGGRGRVRRDLLPARGLPDRHRRRRGVPGRWPDGCGPGS